MDWLMFTCKHFNHMASQCYNLSPWLKLKTLHLYCLMFIVCMTKILFLFFPFYAYRNMHRILHFTSSILTSRKFAVAYDFISIKYIYFQVDILTMKMQLWTKGKIILIITINVCSFRLVAFG